MWIRIWMESETHSSICASQILETPKLGLKSRGKTTNMTNLLQEIISTLMGPNAKNWTFLRSILRLWLVKANFLICPLAPQKLSKLKGRPREKSKFWRLIPKSTDLLNVQAELLMWNRQVRWVALSLILLAVTLRGRCSTSIQSQELRWKMTTTSTTSPLQLAKIWLSENQPKQPLISLWCLVSAWLPRSHPPRKQSRIGVFREIQEILACLLSNHSTWTMCFLREIPVPDLPKILYFQPIRAILPLKFKNRVPLASKL